MSTGGVTYQHDRSSKPPEELLAELVNHHLGVVAIAPSEVKAILTTKWKRITVLAHAIHDSADDGWPKFTPKPDPYAPQNTNWKRDRTALARAMADAADNTSRLMTEAAARRIQYGQHQC